MEQYSGLYIELYILNQVTLLHLIVALNFIVLLVLEKNTTEQNVEFIELIIITHAKCGNNFFYLCRRHQSQTSLRNAVSDIS